MRRIILTSIIFALAQFPLFGQLRDSIYLKEIWTGCTGYAYTYFNRENLLTGYCTDYYSNGVTHIAGNFYLGSVRDTLKEYYPNGNMKYLFIAKEIKADSFLAIHNIFTQFNYEDGTIWRVHDKVLEKETEFYQNGIMKMEVCKKTGILAKKFYPNGKIKVEVIGNNMNEYSESGQLILFISDKKHTKFRKLFKRKTNNRIYSYKIYDDGLSVIRSGNISINSWEYDSLFGEFPDSNELQSLINID